MDDEVIIIVKNIVWKATDCGLPNELNEIPRYVIPTREAIKYYIETEYNHEVKSFNFEVWDNE